jgi:hypothetical protein
VLNFLNSLGIMRKQKPVHAKIVARAMINASKKLDQKLQVWPLLKVFELAG